MIRPYMLLAALLLLVEFGPITAAQPAQKTGPLQDKKTTNEVLSITWDQYLDDFEPSIRSGALALLMSMDMLNKYRDKQIIWTGVYKGLFDKDKKPFVVIGMKPRSIPHRDGQTTVDFLMPNIDASQVEKWSSLKPGDSVRFRLKLSGFVFAVNSSMVRSDVQELRDKTTPVVILFSADDARVVPPK